MANGVTWGIHAGRMADAHSLFLENQVVALGWVEMGNLGSIGATREAFKQAVARAYPAAKAGAIPNNAGQLYRFVHEMAKGDLVVYPSKFDRQVHIGEVTGDYRYEPGVSKDYPNLRQVRWLKTVGRTAFSQGALYEIGSAMSLFQVRTYASEFRAALEGRSAPVPVDFDPTVEQVQSDIEENTRDFVIKTLAQDLKGHPFSEFVAHLLQTMGYRTRVSPEGPDGGVDIIAHKDELGFEPPIVKVQVKSGEVSSVGDPVVTALYGKVDAKQFGLFVTLGSFTNQARQFAKNRANLRLIDGPELVDLILTHYEQFDSRYKGVLPLKRVYIADPKREAVADNRE